MITDNVHCMSVVGGRLDFVCVNVGSSERRGGCGVRRMYCGECRPVIPGNSTLIIISISGLVETNGTYKVAHHVCKIPVFGHILSQMPFNDFEKNFTGVYQVETICISQESGLDPIK